MALHLTRSAHTLAGRKNKKPISLVLLGDIAAGKGTQARILAKRFGLKLIDTGAYSRQLWHSKRMKRVKQGKLAPSDIIQNYLRREIPKVPKLRGILVDGGKMPAEARLIHSIFQKQKRNFLVLYLTIPRTEIFKRLKIRIGEAKRADDSKQAIRNRMNYYKKIYSKTVKYWREKGVLRVMNGNKKVEKVAEQILKEIKKFYAD